MKEKGNKKFIYIHVIHEIWLANPFHSLTVTYMYQFNKLIIPKVVLVYFRQSSSASGKSRLIREDEHDKSDDEEEDEPTMSFGKKVEPGRQMQVRKEERENKRVS